MNLDGETNLKERAVPFEGAVSHDDVHSFNGQIICDQPQESLEAWDGNVHSTKLERVHNCNIKNTLLRGCTLKNTDYCYGVVVYVGADSKIMKNTKKAPRKISKLMRMMDYMLYTVFAFQILLVLIFAGLSLVWTSTNANGHEYLNVSSQVSIVTFIIQFFTYWVAYSHMIPISLYVIIELLKLGQAKIIGRDVKMFFHED